MQAAETGDLEAGRKALAASEWKQAREIFQAILGKGDSAEGFDGLGRSLWWLRQVPAAIDARAQAYRLYAREGRLDEAALVAVWLARELRTSFRNDLAADG